MPRILKDLEQGSARWLYVRLGKVGGSRVSAIVTPTGAPVKGAKRQTLMCELLSERLTGRATETHVSKPMERGTHLESEARSWYQMEQGVDVQEVGYVYGDIPGAGCSPDGLIGDDGVLEIKVPVTHNFVRHMMIGGIPADWIPQCRYNLWLCGRSYLDFVMYTDEQRLPSIVRRIEPDAAYNKSLAVHVKAFCDELDEMEADLRERYEIPYPSEVDIDSLSGDAIPFK